MLITARRIHCSCSNNVLKGKHMGDASHLYSSYDQVPFYRRQWFFWLMYITITPIAITILLLGDVYYKKRGKVKSFGIANRIVAGLIALVILWNIARLFTQV